MVVMQKSCFQHFYKKPELLTYLGNMVYFHDKLHHLYVLFYMCALCLYMYT